MSFQDPISDCLTRIRNGLMRGKDEVSAPYSKVKHELVNVLVSEGYLKSCKKVEEANNKASISITLKYFNEKPAIKNIKRISKPSLRRYSGPEDLKPVKNGLGAYIISTNQGLMTDKQAKVKNIGGEVLCEVF
ncbi:MAG: 30S ribosomal protein S8 [SAR86 cluster bacterium]|jgi:small subunit ribosomal protein S8|uniref:Small ribosomal subunit protein uS8 n=1 Tax=SAR86 cluster bacterium TaxID=2030880 RepID=A0A937J599_9GAMM|nr:30S ribosomal protein S8 [Flavobacteriales bacterium]MBL6902886.1 30S ribosomal protein S8 [SAR86 cluster bacterium]MDG1721595.1 30S ribosomal protein S8 [SAR86 cluster bacterium]